jgi:hypothetical protein
MSLTFNRIGFSLLARICPGRRQPCPFDLSEDAMSQAVMAVGRREGRQEGECLAATVADTAANPDPIMMFIMGLFARRP